MIEVDLPDGSVAEFPDGTPPEAIKSALQKRFGAPQSDVAPEKTVGGFIQNIGADAYNTAAGIVGGLYAGGKKLVTDPVGAAKDVYEFGGALSDVAGGTMNKLGADELNSFLADQGLAVRRDPRDVQREEATAGAVGGYLKNRYWDNLGDTLYEHPVQSAMDVASLAYGGQAALPRAMVGTKRALGAVAEATNPLNAVVKPVNALRGAMAEKSALKKMRADAPSHADVIAQKNALYSTLDNAGIKFDANAYGKMMHSVAGKLKTFRERRAPMTRDLAENVMMNFYGKSPSFRDVEEMLIEAKGILRDHNAGDADKAAAHIVVDELSKFFDNSAVAITNPNANLRGLSVSELTKKARDLARRHILAREVEEMGRKSEWYPSGDESGIRNQFASFGKRQGKSLTPVEEKAAKKVVRREGVHGLLGSAGSKLTQVGLLTSLGFGAGLPAVLAGAGLSLGARAASAGMTNSAVRKFKQTVLAGREAQKKAMLNAKRLPVKTKGLLLGGQGVGLLQGRQ